MVADTEDGQHQEQLRVSVAQLAQTLTLLPNQLPGIRVPPTATRRGPRDSLFWDPTFSGGRFPTERSDRTISTIGWCCWRAPACCPKRNEVRSYLRAASDVGEEVTLLSAVPELRAQIGPCPIRRLQSSATNNLGANSAALRPPSVAVRRWQRATGKGTAPWRQCWPPSMGAELPFSSACETSGIRHCASRQNASRANGAPATLSTISNSWPRA